MQLIRESPKYLITADVGISLLCDVIDDPAFNLRVEIVNNHDMNIVNPHHVSEYQLVDGPGPITEGGKTSMLTPPTREKPNGGMDV